MLWNRESKYFENLTKFASILYFILFSISRNSFHINLTVLQKHISEKSINLKFREKKEKLEFHEFFFNYILTCPFSEKRIILPPPKFWNRNKTLQNKQPKIKQTKTKTKPQKTNQPTQPNTKNNNNNKKRISSVVHLPEIRVFIESWLPF